MTRSLHRRAARSKTRSWTTACSSTASSRPLRRRTPCISPARLHGCVRWGAMDVERANVLADPRVPAGDPTIAPAGTGRFMLQLNDSMQKNMQSGDMSLLAEVHATTWIAAAGIEECRRCCGGYATAMPSARVTRVPREDTHVRAGRDTRGSAGGGVDAPASSGTATWPRRACRRWQRTTCRTSPSKGTITCSPNRPAVTCSRCTTRVARYAGVSARHGARGR